MGLVSQNWNTILPSLISVYGKLVELELHSNLNINTIFLKSSSYKAYFATLVCNLAY